MTDTREPNVGNPVPTHDPTREPPPASIPVGPGTRAGAAVRTITAFGFALPIGAYFWFIHHYAVNVIVIDQWDNVNIIGRSYSGTLSLANLWTQHNEHRIFFPNLIVLVLAHTTHLNVVVEEYLSGTMLVLAMGLIVLSHKHRSASVPWLYYVPVPILMLSFVQFEDTLSGFQLAWYLVLLSLAVTIFLLERSRFGWLVLSGAIGAAIVGSFSSFQGLLIWAVGLALLYGRRRPRRLVIAWAASAAVTVALYTYHLKLENNSYSFHHPLEFLKFFFFTLGDVIGVVVPKSSGSGNDAAVILLGVIIFALAVWAVTTQGLRRRNDTGSLVGQALICFGLLFAASTAIGRSSLGLAVADSSRYTTFDLLVLVGCYLAMLGRSSTQTSPSRQHRVSLSVARAVLVGVILIQVVLGLDNGIVRARGWHTQLLIASDVAANIDEAPDGLVQSYLWDNAYFVTYVRQMAKVARKYRLSLFNTSAVAFYERKGLPADITPPVTHMERPRNHAFLSGDQVLNAMASDDFAVTKVEYRLTGGNLMGVIVASGVRTVYGWLARWDTTKVANGTYTLQSVAFDAAGNSGHSAGVVVTVGN